MTSRSNLHYLTKHKNKRVYGNIQSAQQVNLIPPVPNITADDSLSSPPTNTNMNKNKKPQGGPKPILPPQKQKAFLKFKESSLKQLEKKRQEIDARKNLNLLQKLNPDDQEAEELPTYPTWTPSFVPTSSFPQPTLLKKTPTTQVFTAKTPKPQTVTNKPPRQTVTNTPQRQTVTNTPQRQTVTNTPQRQTVTNTPPRQTVTTPQRQTVTNTPQRQTVTNTPQRQTVANTPQQQTVAPNTPTTQGVSNKKKKKKKKKFTPLAAAPVVLPRKELVTPVTSEIVKPPSAPSLQVTRPNIPQPQMYNMRGPHGIPRCFLLNPLPGIVPPSTSLYQPWSPAPEKLQSAALPQTPQTTNIPQHLKPGLLPTPLQFLVPQQATNSKPQPSTSRTANIGQTSTAKAAEQTSAQTSKPDMEPIFVDINADAKMDSEQVYSPSDVYAESVANSQDVGDDDDVDDDVNDDDDDEDNSNQSGQKRMSVFQRLGPVSQPKKPKLTINVSLDKEQPTREVEYETEEEPEKFTPVHLRPSIVSSTDETVMKYLPKWPWRKNVSIRKCVGARYSKSVMILEQEQMEELYESDNLFVMVTVKGYPPSWNKEEVLDAILEYTRGYCFIPCFTEFNRRECKFLVLRSRQGLVAIHKTGFRMQVGQTELILTICKIALTTNHVDFIPRLVLRRRFVLAYEGGKLDLSAFTLNEDISHFLYFPLHHLTNRKELAQLLTVVDWKNLTGLDLSHNKLTDLEGFELLNITPNLNQLNLSYNYLERLSELLKCRGLSLNSIDLEGNPFCTDYTDPAHYVNVIRMMFPCVKTIDGVAIRRKGEFPQIKRNYCPEEALVIVEKFLDVYFPIIDSDEDRPLLQEMYDKNAVLSVTYNQKLRYSVVYRGFPSIFIHAHSGLFSESLVDRSNIQGDIAIMKLIKKWPRTEHDPTTFTVDVLYHSEYSTMIRIGGILRLTGDSMADDRHLVSFTKTLLLVTENGSEYKICNELLYWDQPTNLHASTAFKTTTLRNKLPKLKIEATDDEDLKAKYLKIFMSLTTMDEKVSERCLETKNWNLRDALEHFTKLLRLDDLESLMK